MRLPLVAGIAALVTTPTAFTFTDQSATYLAAHSLLTRGTMYVSNSDISDAVSNEFHNGISDRMPGMIAVMLPFAFNKWLAIVVPAFLAIAASLWLIDKLWGNNSALIAVIATPLVYVGRESWPQTISIPILLAGLYALRKGRSIALLPIVTALALIRPPFAIFAVTLYLLVAFRKDVAAYAGIGLGLAGIILLTYTHHYFGRWGLTGGYALDGHGSQPILSTLYTGMISPQRGLLFYCPWLLLIRPNRVIILAFLYVLAEWQQYNAWGGSGYYGFRYALPLVILCIPTLKLSRLSTLLLGWSVGVGTYCLLFDRYTEVNTARDPNLVPTALYLFGIVGIFLYGSFKIVDKTQKLSSLSSTNPSK